MADTLEMGGICFEAGAMVGIAFHQVADCVQKAPLRVRRLGSKLPMALRSAVPVVVMNLVLIGLVAFRFWATFPVVDDVAAGSCNVPVRTSGTHRGACQDIPTEYFDMSQSGPPDIDFGPTACWRIHGEFLSILS